MPKTSQPSVSNLRVCRHWRWVPVPGVEVRYGGGPGPMQLEATDVLETLVNGEWVPVPVVEMPKPEHPAEAARRQRQEQMAAGMAEMFKNIQVLAPGESPFKTVRRRDG